MSARAADDPAGQHRATGNALVGLGAVGIAVGVASLILHLELRFIDGGTMAVTGLGMAAAGAWQRAAARKFRREIDG